MGQTEIIIFIVLTSVVSTLFLMGIAAFFVQYRKRKQKFEREKDVLIKVHHQVILQTQFEIQQQTMQHIGREIHDNVGQKLTLASIYNNQLEAEGLNETQQEKLKKIGAILNESLTELRGLSKSLTSTYIADTPLEILLEDELEKTRAAGRLNVVKKIRLTAVASILVKTIVVRIVQEFLQNSLKHARCKNITFELQETERGLEMLLKDDGAGFDPGKEYSGIGLFNMKRRAEMICGELSVQSIPGEGTSLSLIIPLNQLQS